KSDLLLVEFATLNITPTTYRINRLNPPNVDDQPKIIGKGSYATVHEIEGYCFIKRKFIKAAHKIANFVKAKMEIIHEFEILYEIWEDIDSELEGGRSPPYILLNDSHIGELFDAPLSKIHELFPGLVKSNQLRICQDLIGFLSNLLVNEYIHTDIKSENIVFNVVSEKFIEAKFIDFGADFQLNRITKESNSVIRDSLLVNLIENLQKWTPTTLPYSQYLKNIRSLISQKEHKNLSFDSVVDHLESIQIFSLGVTLYTFITKVHPYNFTLCKNFDSFIEFHDKYATPFLKGDKTEEHQKQLKENDCDEKLSALILSMIHPDHYNRATVDTLIEYIEDAVNP
ncbi:hypothetical protein N9Y92_02965, partial [Chlamydiales bacterium]|nr:hypothetical protein [Chlamydiales bacterium]